MRVELTFYGPLVSKKNSYRAVVRKKTGKAALVKDRKLTGKLNYLAQQIPVELWDLGMLNPSITMTRTGDHKGDRDGAFTTLLDLLVRTGVLVDDSDVYNNGHWEIYPTEPGVGLKTVLVLRTSE